MDNNMNINMNINNIINNNTNNNQTNKEKSLLEKISYILVYIEMICVGIFFILLIMELAGINYKNTYIITMLDLYVCTFSGILELIVLSIGKSKKLFKIKTQLIITLISLCVPIILIGILIYRRVVMDYTITSIDKPIIYLYPEEETEVSVKLDNKDNITCSYPKYIDGWDVYAKPNGDLTYTQDGKELYSLYYEAENEESYKVEEDGFVVKGEDTAKFLEEKLDVLGLNYKEKEEFIVYWLPKLEANKYNYIRFATMDEINQNMKLEFSKKPDTLIRVIMTYKGLESPIEVKEQELKTPERKGFVAVEWGGSEIK